MTLRPPDWTSIVIWRAWASSEFSTSSLTTLAGRSTTSPAAIWFATCSGRRRIRFMAARRSPCFSVPGKLELELQHESRFRRGLERQREAKQRAAVRHVARVNAPAVLLDDSLRDAQSKATPPRFAERLACLETPVHNLR